MSLHVYIIRRLLYIIPVIFGVCLIIFLLFNIFSPDPAMMVLGKHATVSQIADLREEMGLNRPLVLQYLDVVKSAFTFDFGRSWNTKQDIFEMIKAGAGPSLSLTVPAFIVSAIISLSISLLVSYYRGSFIDRFFVLFCVSLQSVSILVYIIFFQWALAYKAGLFEISGFDFSNPTPYIILPGIIFVILSLGPDIRFYRTVMLDEVYQDYVRTARAKGLGERVILFKHVLKNAMISVITYIVIQIPFLILGALLLENFFSIPGLGSITLTAINSSDFPVIKAVTVLSAMAFILFSVITDVLYTFVDPRVRLK